MVARRIRFAIAAVVILGITIVLPGSTPPAFAQTTPACGATQQAVLVLASDQKTALAFRRERGERRLQLRFDVTECEFTDEDVSQSDPSRRVEVIGTVLLPIVDKDGNELKTRPSECTQNVCVFTPGRIESRSTAVIDIYVDPASSARPGTYNSAMLITDERVKRTLVPFTVTLQYDRGMLLAATVFIPAVLIGWLLIWWKSHLATNGDSVWRWWTKFGNLLAVGAGLAAARAIWAKAYLDVPDFGADLKDGPWYSWVVFSGEWWTLVTLVGTAYIGAVTAATLGGDRARNGPDSPPGGGPILQAITRRRAGRSSATDTKPAPE